MGKIEAYEHRGARYRALRTETPSQVQDVLRCFHEEEDIWLKKILAMKLNTQSVIQLDEPDRALILEAMKCQIG